MLQILDADTDAYLEDTAVILTSNPEFANGRDIEDFVRKLFALQAKKKTSVITIDTLNDALSKFRDNQVTTLAKVKQITSNDFEAKPAMSFDTQRKIKNNTSQNVAAIIIKDESEIVHEQKVLEVDDINNDDYSKYLHAMQVALDSSSVINEEGLRQLVGMDVNNEDLHDIINFLATTLQMDVPTIKTFIKKWQFSSMTNLDIIENSKRELENAKREKKKARVPIWRCGVCGRADKPYIVCYVQPYVVKYELVDA